ncbi:MAG: NADH-quinone oxidoreductase subunit N [Actinomycetota bacterium]|nr:NADH-quinone oxidoreductase subunit N [Actinomycetota bacterium]
MGARELIALLPIILISVSAVLAMLATAFIKSESAPAYVSAIGFVIAFISLFVAYPELPRAVTPLLIMDYFSYFYIGLIILAGLAVSLLAYPDFKKRGVRQGEFHVLLLLSVAGSATLAASAHFASFLLGLEILSVSLYAMIAYDRPDIKGLEAGTKYLVLASVSAAFLFFGMAMVYAGVGTMDLAGIAVNGIGGSISALAGIAMILVGIGFKLALVPFHMWTPDVYEGAPSPVTAFVASASKGAVFALVLRYFTQAGIHDTGALAYVLLAVSIASMFIGNLLALLQENLKRLLAYSSIAHLGYLLLLIAAGGRGAFIAGGYYLAAYFAAIIGAFGIISALSTGRKEPRMLDDIRGLAWESPWLAGFLSAMLLSLAGIPLTAGFIAKFYIISLGISKAMWWPVIMLIINSVIGLAYYLRVIAAVYERPQKELFNAMQTGAEAGKISLISGGVLAVLSVITVILGIYPPLLLKIIERTL